MLLNARRLFRQFENTFFWKGGQLHRNYGIWIKYYYHLPRTTRSTCHGPEACYTTRVCIAFCCFQDYFLQTACDLTSSLYSQFARERRRSSQQGSSHCQDLRTPILEYRRLGLWRKFWPDHLPKDKMKTPEIGPKRYVYQYKNQFM